MVAALIAHAAFWFLLPYGDALFSSYVGVLDIVLVFLIFKGDVHIT